jgi:YidC/Oxa1 family membrane protein insertase
MDQRNLILAIVISAAILFGWTLLQPLVIPPPPPAPEQQAQQPPTPAPAPGQQGTTEVPGTAPTRPLVDRAAALAQSPRVPIESPRLKGSLALKGGRIDDVVLVRYRETIDPGSPNIVLLSPAGAANAYFAEVGWVGQGTRLPDDDSLWQADGDKLTPERPLTLTWDNGEGVRFVRVLALDPEYMFTVTEKVENSGGAPLTLQPYGRIRRTGIPELGITQILHEGPIGVFGDPATEVKYTLAERQYDDMREEGRCDAENPENRHESVGGWLGITDKYWLVALVPDSTQRYTACYRWEVVGDKDAFQTDYLGAALTVAAGASAQAQARLFTGAKEVRLLDAYQEGHGGDPIPLLDRAVDFAGYLGYFLTLIAKPLFYLLDIIYSAIGNFGIAIMVLTVLVKTVFFPLANKSYRAMNRMKKLAPQMQELKARFGDDKARLNQELMALYKREKVNPAAGCLPILVQIPVFIALYQVLYVTIEMRHAPFFGWIKDLSAPDPTSIFNLFGLLPYDVPDLGVLSLFSIGVWPLVMGVTMFLQQKMNPPPPDPVQAKMFMMLPIVFTFMLAPFAAGLVIYWAWNNLLSIAQQWLLKRLDERAEARAKTKRLEQKAEQPPEEAPERRYEKEPESGPAKPSGERSERQLASKSEKRRGEKQKKRM